MTTEQQKPTVPEDPCSFDSQEELCPICLLPQSEDRQFCTAPCSHRFCVPDAERVLLTKPGLAVNNHESTPADPYQVLPTLGRCPICRRALNLFDLQLPEGDLYQKDTDSPAWPVAGKLFAERNKGLSLSFETAPTTLSWYNDPDDDEHQVATFQPGSHFHHKSRTFHGQLDIGSSSLFGDDSSSLLTGIFQFSSDLRFIAVGALMAKDGDSRLRIVQFLGVGGRLLCSSGPSHNVRPTYCGETLWGNTFCQGFKVGLASYQFVAATSTNSDSQDEAYISYEHPISSQWPPLDDGSPVPSRVYFRNATFDTTERIFTGDICWFQDFGTTWQGYKKWSYSMKFDANFTFIASGTVHSILNESEELHQLMSSFGDDLIYINAAIDSRFQRLATDAEENEEGVMISDRFIRLSQPLQQEWTRGGASVRVIAMLHSALTKVVMGQPSPIDFNLSS